MVTINFDEKNISLWPNHLIGQFGRSIKITDPWVNYRICTFEGLLSCLWCFFQDDSYMPFKSSVKIPRFKACFYFSFKSWIEALSGICIEKQINQLMVLITVKNCQFNIWIAKSLKLSCWASAAEDDFPNRREKSFGSKK